MYGHHAWSILQRIVVKCICPKTSTAVSVKSCDGCQLSAASSNIALTLLHFYCSGAAYSTSLIFTHGRDDVSAAFAEQLHAL